MATTTANSRDGSSVTTPTPLGDYVMLTLIGLVGTVTLGTWAAGQLAGLLFRFTWPRTPFGQAYTVTAHWPHHWSDPRQAWPVAVRGQLPGPVGMYVATLLILAALGTAVVFAMRWRMRSRQHRGFASRTDLDKALTPAAAMSRADRLRPDLTRRARTLSDVAIGLGRAVPSRLPLAASIENGVLLLAAPRQGKSSQVIIPWLTDWSGPAVVTSIRGDVIDNTLALRRERGPVAIIDFDQHEWPFALRWSPLVGCDRYDMARQRAELMVQVGKAAAGGGDSTNAGFFGLTAHNLLAGWMHAAAISGRTMYDVLRWALTEGDDEPITLLAGTATADPLVAQVLEGIYNAPAETRSNMWATAMTAVAPLVGEAAGATFCPTIADSFDIEAFLNSSGTIYIQVSKNQVAGLRPLLTAFVDEITTVAQRLATRSGHGRLTPPLGLLLDEVANVVPLPELPALMSYAAGSGIFIVAVLQSLAQAEERWGQLGAKMLWGAATVKIALGGLAGHELDDLSRLAGKYRETVTAIQRGPHGITSMPSLQERQTITPDEIRTLSEERREALVIHATTRAVKTIMVRHYDGPHRKRYAAARAQAQQLRLIAGAR